MSLLLRIDWGDIGGGVAVAAILPGLLAVPDEVLEVLYCGHDYGCGLEGEGRVYRSR